MTISATITGAAMLLTALLGLAGAQQGPIEMASIFNKNPVRSSTSSTLGWVSSRIGEQPPPGAVPITGSSDAWCRSNQHGQWAAGAVRGGKCHYPFLATVFVSDDYDTLVSVNGSARLKHVDWDKFSVLPNNGVTTPQMILSVLEDPETGVFKPGFVEINGREPYFLSGDEVEKSEKATLITEEEPKEYELFSIVLSEKNAKKKFSDVQLVEVYLENTSTEEKLVDVDEDYMVKTEQYWGSVKGTVSGLSFSTPEKSGLFWGTYNEGSEKHSETVSYLLPPGAGVKGRLVANMSQLEAPYTASLTAIFEDGFQITRPIASLHTDLRMAELRVDFDRPFNLADGTPIDSYNQTSAVLRHSTTTTTTTTTTTSTTTAAPPADKPARSLQVGASSAWAPVGGTGLLLLAVLAAALLH